MDFIYEVDIYTNTIECDYNFCKRLKKIEKKNRNHVQCTDEPCVGPTILTTWTAFIKIRRYLISLNWHGSQTPEPFKCRFIMYSSFSLSRLHSLSLPYSFHIGMSIALFLKWHFFLFLIFVVCHSKVANISISKHFELLELLNIQYSLLLSHVGCFGIKINFPTKGNQTKNLCCARDQTAVRLFFLSIRNYILVRWTNNFRVRFFTLFLLSFENFSWLT